MIRLLVMFIHLFLVSFLMRSQTEAEIFTAMTEMKHLIKTHRSVMQKLSNHITEEEQRLTNLAVHVNKFKKERLHVNSLEYLRNPFNVFHLLNRLISDILTTEKVIQKTLPFERNEKLLYPQKVDFVGAAQALARLQETYRLNASRLAKGNLIGISSTPFTQSDCYELARGMYMAGNFEFGTDWMGIAYKMYNKQVQDTHSFRLADIAEQASFGYHKIKKYKSAGDWLNVLLHLKPGNPEYNDHFKSVDYFQDLQNRQELEELSRIQNKRPQPKPKPEVAAFQKQKAQFERACRLERDIPDSISHRLTCQYFKETHPFLKIAPIKMEKLFLSPDILMFHEIINDSEIQILQKLSKPKLKRGKLKNTKNGEDVEHPYLINKSAWLADNESVVVNDLTRRISYFTGHNMKYSPELKIGNYGLAGYFAPHYDSGFIVTKGKENKAIMKVSNNRLATVTIYLSNVAFGGETVFLNLGLSVKPLKGSALYWQNLAPTGQTAPESFHAACPVIHGSKWIATKWILTTGNEKQCPIAQNGLRTKIPRRRRRESFYSNFTK